VSGEIGELELNGGKREVERDLVVEEEAETRCLIDVMIEVQVVIVKCVDEPSFEERSAAGKGGGLREPRDEFRNLFSARARDTH
jgi:hypothetical protein